MEHIKNELIISPREFCVDTFVLKKSISDEEIIYNSLMTRTERNKRYEFFNLDQSNQSKVQATKKFFFAYQRYIRNVDIMSVPNQRKRKKPCPSRQAVVLVSTLMYIYTIGSCSGSQIWRRVFSSISLTLTDCELIVIQ